MRYPVAGSKLNAAVDLSREATGIYLISVTTADKTITGKVFIQ
jgi:hypothetical protein